MPPSYRHTLPVGVALLMATAFALPGTAGPAPASAPRDVPAAAAGSFALPDTLGLTAVEPAGPPARRVPAAGTEADLPLPAPAVAPPAAPEPVRVVAPSTASRSVTRTAPAAAPSTVRPNDGPVTSGFGRRWGKQHAGLDFGGGYGSPIRSVQAGTVTFAGSASGYGNLVVVRHADGFSTAYGHMSVITVSTGEEVDAGDRIAEVGNEGRSTGPHLHFEVRVGEDKIDPASWLTKRGVRL